MTPGLKFLDLFCLGLILLVTIFSAVRFSDLPQWVDAYYHLSAANGFVESGGWVGWNWWDFAPGGRPNLYPPVYHLILAFLMKAGLNAVDCARLAEVLIVPLFFFTAWYVLRELAGSRFSFFALLALTGFTAFYISVPANAPASIAVIFGLLGWLFIKRRNIICAGLSLALAFYSHTGVALAFLVSLAFAAFEREYRRTSLGSLLTGVVLALPLFLHQAKYAHFLRFHMLGEVRFIVFSLFAVLVGVASLVMHFGKRNFITLLFWGYLIGSGLVFIKYPYRFFSAQGVIGPVLFASLALDKWASAFHDKKRTLFVAGVAAYLLFFHSTFSLGGGATALRAADSTYYNFLTGKIYRFAIFRSFDLEALEPLTGAIKENSGRRDIIASNVDIAAQTFGALTGRPSANSMFGEVAPREGTSYYDSAKLIVWVNLPIGDITEAKRRGWEVIHEDDFARLYLNPSYTPLLKKVRSKVNFGCIAVIIIMIAATYTFCHSRGSMP